MVSAMTARPPGDAGFCAVTGSYDHDRGLLT
jgi:hypothetical protein